MILLTIRVRTFPFGFISICLTLLSSPLSSGLSLQVVLSGRLSALVVAGPGVNIVWVSAANIDGISSLAVNTGLKYEMTRPCD